MTTRSGVKFIVGRDFNTGLVKSPLSSTGAAGTFFAGAKVPLLRGFGVNEKMVGERQAILGIPLADRNLDAVRLSALLTAADSYWEWVAAGQKRTVARDLLRLAELRATQIRRENALGAQPDIAVTEADQEVQRRRGSLVKAGGLPVEPGWHARRRAVPGRRAPDDTCPCSTGGGHHRK
jgi:outer membrane protein TolC